jgi:hypothetical protein
VANFSSWLCAFLWPNESAKSVKSVVRRNFNQMRRGGEKNSNIFNRFYTNFDRFHTFFQIFRKFSHFLTVFKHELARLVLSHFTYFTQIAEMAYATPHLKLSPRSAAEILEA